MNSLQILTIARYEMLMAYRRRTLVIIGLLLLLGLIVFTKISLDANQAFNTIARAEGSVITTVDETGREVLLPQTLPSWLEGINLDVWMGGAIILTSLTINMIVVSITLVMFVSEVIPLDGLYRVRELIHALPLGRGSYLMGKLLGVWFGLLAVIGVGIVVSAVWFRVNFTYDVRYFLLLWVVAVIPVVLVCGALAVLFTSWLTSRRIAVLISLLALPVALFVVVMGITTLTGVGIYLEPSYAYYAYISPENRSIDAITQRIVTTLLTFVGMLIAVWTAAWVWQRFREAR